MSLKEAFEAVTPKTVCPVWRLLNELPPDDVEYLTTVVIPDQKRWSARAVLQILNLEYLTESGLKRHRQGLCRCANQ